MPPTPGHPRAGLYTPQPEGYSAFEPRPLVAGMELDYRVLAEPLAEANLALGRLDGLGTVIPDQRWFVAMYVRKEAVISSEIEGTQASLSDLLQYEAGERSEDTEKKLDLDEIVNYIHALEGGLEALKERRLDVVLIQNLHADLMRGVRGKNKSPGAIRTRQNWISRSAGRHLDDHVQDAAFVPPPPQSVAALMADLEQYLGREDMPALIQAGIAHSQFETIHPFLDGNGRLGRLLITLLLCQRRVMASPLLYLSAYFAERKADYYAELMRVRHDGAWESWLVFFLRGVELVAKEAAATALRVIELRKNHLDLITLRMPDKPTAPRLLQKLFEHPILTVKQMSEMSGISIPTANSLASDFRMLGLLRETTGLSRGRVFEYRPYLDALSPGGERPPGRAPVQSNESTES